MKEKLYRKMEYAHLVALIKTAPSWKALAEIAESLPPHEKEIFWELVKELESRKASRSYLPENRESTQD